MGETVDDRVKENRIGRGDDLARFVSEWINERQRFPTRIFTRLSSGFKEESLLTASTEPYALLPFPGGMRVISRSGGLDEIELTFLEERLTAALIDRYHDIAGRIADEFTPSGLVFECTLAPLNVLLALVLPALDSLSPSSGPLSVLRLLRREHINSPRGRDREDIFTRRLSGYWAGPDGSRTVEALLDGPLLTLSQALDVCSAGLTNGLDLPLASTEFVEYGSIPPLVLEKSRDGLGSIAVSGPYMESYAHLVTQFVERFLAHPPAWLESWPAWSNRTGIQVPPRRDERSVDQARDASSPRLDPPQVASPETPNVFRNEGDYWTISFNGKRIVKKHRKGFHYLSHILASTVPVSIEVLERLAEPGNSNGMRQKPSESELREDGLSFGRIPSSQPILDDQAVRDYRDRISEIDAALDQDHVEETWASKLRAEKSIIEKQLQAAIRPGGIRADFRTPEKKAVERVTKAVQRAIDDIRVDNPELAQFLMANVRYAHGHYVYVNCDEVPWDIRRDVS